MLETQMCAYPLRFLLSILPSHLWGLCHLKHWVTLFLVPRTALGGGPLFVLSYKTKGDWNHVADSKFVGKKPALLSVFSHAFLITCLPFHPGTLSSWPFWPTGGFSGRLCRMEWPVVLLWDSCQLLWAFVMLCTCPSNCHLPCSLTSVTSFPVSHTELSKPQAGAWLRSHLENGNKLLRTSRKAQSSWSLQNFDFIHVSFMMPIRSTSHPIQRVGFVGAYPLVQFCGGQCTQFSGVVCSTCSSWVLGALRNLLPQRSLLLKLPHSEISSPLRDLRPQISHPQRSPLHLTVFSFRKSPISLHCKSVKWIMKRNDLWPPPPLSLSLKEHCLDSD